MKEERKQFQVTVLSVRVETLKFRFIDHENNRPWTLHVLTLCRERISIKDTKCIFFPLLAIAKLFKTIMEWFDDAVNE